MSLLISQGITPAFDPSSGFPYEQAPTPPAYLIPRRCVALMIAAAVLAPPPQMGTAVRLNGAAQNNGLVRTANLPGPSTWSICTFFYLPQAPSGDASLWMLQDTNGSSPTSYINLEVNGSLSLLIASNTQPGITLGTVAIKQWYFVCVSIGAGGAGNAYWGKVGAAALTTTALTSLSTGWTPASLTVGTDFFTEPIDARLCDFIVHTAALSSGEALAQSRRLRPQRTANLLEWWQLKSAATKLEESSGPQRVLTAIGAGSWLTEEGPLLLDGPLDPGIEGFPYEQPPDFARAKDNRRWLYPEGEVPLSLAAPPTVTPGWYPDYPDFARGAPPLLRTGDFELVVQEREPVTDWLPDFPDFAARSALRPLNTGGLSWTNVEREPITDWLPDFPDFARTKTPLVNQGGLFWTNVEREPITDWLPDFPDFARSSAPLVREGWEALWPLPITPVVVPAQFQPEYPDQIYAKARPLNTGGLSWTNLEREPAVTDWLPDFSDFARVPRAPLNVGGLSLWPLPIASVVVPTQFHPEYPDQTYAKARPLNVGGLSWSLITPVVALTQFHPEYPDQVYARARPLDVGGLFWTNVEREPVVDWLPDFPDFACRAATPLVPVGWTALYPSPLGSPFIFPTWGKGAAHAVGDDGRRFSSNDGRTRATLANDARLDTVTDTGKRRDDT